MFKGTVLCFIHTFKIIRVVYWNIHLLRIFVFISVTMICKIIDKDHKDLGNSSYVLLRLKWQPLFSFPDIHFVFCCRC